MFRDTQEELKRLEEELLQEEDAEETVDPEYIAEDDLEEDSAHEYYDPSRIYNTDNLDEDPERLSSQVLRPRKKTGLGVAICLLLLASTLLIVAAVVLYLRG